MPAISPVRTRLILACMLIVLLCSIGSFIAARLDRQERKNELDQMRQRSDDLEKQMQLLDKQVEMLEKQAKKSRGTAEARAAARQ